MNNIRLGDAVDLQDARMDAAILTVKNYVGTDNILQNKEGIKDSSYVPTTGKTAAYKTGDILIANIRPYLKKIWFATNEGGSSADVTTLRVKAGFDPKFVYYSLLQDDFFDYAMKGAKGSKMPRLDKKQILDFPIMAPDLSMQKSIARTLSLLDDKIALNRRINAKLEALVRDFYNYWFVQFEFPDANNRPYKTAGGAMVYNAELKRKIPATWSVGGLNQFIANEKTGDWGKESTQANYTRQVTCIRGTDLNSILKVQELNAPVRYILEKNTHKLLQKNDIVIEISGGSPTQSTGRAAYITDEVMSMFDNPLICSNFCKAVSVKKDLHLFFVYYLWQHLYDNDVFFGYEGKTSGIKNLLYENFINSYKVVLPDEEILTKFNDAIRPLSLAIVANRKEAMRLLSARDWLLPMLMNGQLKVID